MASVVLKRVDKTLMYAIKRGRSQVDGSRVRERLFVSIRLARNLSNGTSVINFMLQRNIWVSILDKNMFPRPNTNNFVVN